MYYHGARYYAPWLERWVSCDPAGMVDGVNLYGYSRNNPVHFADREGMQSRDATNITFSEADVAAHPEVHVVEGKTSPQVATPKVDLTEIRKQYSSATTKERKRLNEKYHLKLTTSGELTQELSKGTSELLKSSVATGTVNEISHAAKGKATLYTVGLVLNMLMPLAAFTAWVLPAAAPTAPAIGAIPAEEALAAKGAIGAFRAAQEISATRNVAVATGNVTGFAGRLFGISGKTVRSPHRSGCCSSHSGCSAHISDPRRATHVRCGNPHFRVPGESIATRGDRRH